MSIFKTNDEFNSFSPPYPTIWGLLAAFISGSLVVLSVLPRWNGVSRLSFSKKRLNLQNKYLITVHNNNKKINKT
jgi:hypothetical protein